MDKGGVIDGFGLLDDCIDLQPDPEFAEERRLRKVAARSMLTRSRANTSRAGSEAELARLLPERIASGAAWHVMSGGNIDALSFLANMLRAGPADHVIVSTWCMSLDDVNQLGAWLDAGAIARLDVYAGDYFVKRYAETFHRLCEILRTHPGGGRACIFRNHSKVIVLASHARRYYLVAESSANILANPRSEQTCVTRSQPLAEFYRDFYDGVRSHQRNFDHWTPHGWPPAKAHRAQAH